MAQQIPYGVTGTGFVNDRVLVQLICLLIIYPLVVTSQLITFQSFCLFNDLLHTAAQVCLFSSAIFWCSLFPSSANVANVCLSLHPLVLQAPVLVEPWPTVFSSTYSTLLVAITVAKSLWASEGLLIPTTANCRTVENDLEHVLMWHHNVLDVCTSASFSSYREELLH